MGVLIETLWNVKSTIFCNAVNKSEGINRNIVECKVDSMGKSTR